MSHTKRKNYVLYTLCRTTDYTRYTEGVIRTSTLGKTTFGWIPSYYTREALIGKIATNKVHSCKGSSILENLSADMSERIPSEHRVTTNDSLFGYRVHLMYDNVYFIGKVSPDGRISYVNIDELYGDIAVAITKLENKKKKRLKTFEYRKSANRFKFRSGNVPCISHYKYHRGNYYRIPKLKNVATMNSSCEEETKAFVSNKYKTKNLPVWDDRVRHNDKSWKTSYKIRKQWMKHLNNHIDTDFNILDMNKNEELM